MEKVSGVYQIKNKVNEKVYVGSSSDIYKRWRSHLNCAYNNNSYAYAYLLYEDIRKYGLANFSFKVLEVCSEEEKINLERQYYNLLKPEYNQRFPSDFEKNLDKDDFRSKCKAAWDRKCDEDKEKILENLRLGKGGRKDKKPILAIDVYTGSQIFFESLLDAQETLNIPRSSISQILNPNHKRQKTKGFTFIFVD